MRIQTNARLSIRVSKLRHLFASPNWIVIGAILFLSGVLVTVRRPVVTAQAASPINTLATLTVTKVADTDDGTCDSDCSLREAIAVANSAATASNIQFDPTTFATPQTISLASGPLIFGGAASITVIGTGVANLTVDAHQASRVVLVNTGSNVSLSGITISGGKDATAGGTNGGGGIRNQGSLSLSNVVVSNNQATNFGGGLLSVGSGTVTSITNSLITHNTAGSGGGICYSGGTSMNVTDSVVSDNTADTSFGGGIYDIGQALVLERVNVTGNTAENSGGGMANSSNATVRGSNFTNNHTNNSQSAGGGGLYNSGTISVSGSTFNNNISAGGGGGMSNQGSASLTVTDSAIYGNQARVGGGIGSALQGVTTLTNVTIAGNAANVSSGGGIGTTGIVNLTHVTVTRNTAVSGGGGIDAAPGLAQVNARNSIIAHNVAPSGSDFTGPLNSQGFNLIENSTGATITGTTSNNILAQDPQLLPLAVYGGATKTCVPRPTSPVVDQGNSFGSIVDQRGKSRPYDNAAIPNASGGDGADMGAAERQLLDFPKPNEFDFDGDGKTDLGVFRPSAGIWYVLRSGNNSVAATPFGQNGDQIVPADYDGDGKTDVAVFRGGNWYYLTSEDNSFHAQQFGSSGDIPAPADYDGDAKSDFGVFRQGVWYLLGSQAGFSGVQFGQTGDVPVPADYDGDGRTDIAVFRAGVWYLLNTSTGFTGVQFGQAGDVPVAGDYDGDGKADEAVYRQGVWYLLRSSAGFTGIQFGIATDRPVPGDYDGDGKQDVAVFRADTWFVINSSNSAFVATQFGANGDQPTPAAYLP